jgi:hypothetical protein
VDTSDPQPPDTKRLTALLELEPQERLCVTTGISLRNNQVHHFRPWGLLNVMQQLGAVAICSSPHIKQAVTSGKTLSIFHKTKTPQKPYQKAQFSRIISWVNRTNIRRTSGQQLMSQPWQCFCRTKLPYLNVSITDSFHTLRTKCIQKCLHNQHLICTTVGSLGEK